jgi:PKD repeat protein
MKFYARFSFLVFLFFSLIAIPAFAQTITIGTVDVGPYTPQSNVAVPIAVTGPCIGVTTKYTLYISNTTTFTTKQSIGVFNNFYATFVNGTIPNLSATFTPGTYYLRVETNDATPIISSTYATITVVAGAAVKPSADGINIDPYPTDAFANCANLQTTAKFLDKSTGATTITATLHDEVAGTDANVSPGLGTSYSFPILNRNYTLYITASNGVTKSTKAYAVVNNVSKSTFGTSANQSTCAGGDLTFNVDYTSPDGIQNNFPGNTYQFNWGDGSPVTTLTLCQIIALNGHVTHTYTASSCGSTINGTINVFKVGITPVSPYCGSLSEVSTTANIKVPARNIVGFRGIAMVGGEVGCSGIVNFSNLSNPGGDPNSVGDCSRFSGARYTWLVDGVEFPTGINVPIGTGISPHLTSGKHTITLQYNNNRSCGGEDITVDICVLDKPQPAFIIPASACTSAPVIPTDQSIIDNNAPCANVNSYSWKVTDANGNATTAFNFIDFTNANTPVPHIQFTAPGTYKVSLDITTPNCGTITSTIHQIIINLSPTATLSANTIVCSPQSLVFDGTNNSITKTTYSTTLDASDTYTWTVTGAGGILPATFIGGTTAASKFPQINFPDIGDYTVTLVYGNNCGNSPAYTQVISVKQAPSLTVNSSSIICPSLTPYQINGTITGDMTTVQSFAWSKTINGITTTAGISDIHSLTPTYTPTTADYGKTITFTLKVQTTLAQCSVIQKSFDLTIIAPDAQTSSAADAVCSGATLNHKITSTNASATYTWTAVASSSDITGFTANGTGSLITDHLTNSSATTSGTVTYTITPIANGCPSATFDYVVTVNPLPTATTTQPTAPICSGTRTSIGITPSIANTKFTWTILKSANVTGATAQSIPTTLPLANGLPVLDQTLTNTGTALETVVYTITPVGPTGCPGAALPSVVIEVNPNPTVAVADVNNPGPNPTLRICGSSTTISRVLNANAPGALILGTGKWSQPVGQTAVFANDTDPKTTVSGLVAGQAYTLTWTITSGCGASHQDIVVTVDLPSIGGTTLFTNGTDKLTICRNDGGTINLTGNVGNIIRWEQSTDNGVTWATIAGNHTTATYTFTNLQQSTSFRAVSLNGTCTSANSTSAVVTVNLPTAPALAGNAQTLCNQTSVTLAGNAPPAGTSAKWTLTSGQTGVTFDDDTKPNAVASGLVGGVVYAFTWTFNDLSVCGINSSTVNITNQSAIINTLPAPANSIVCPGSNIVIGGNAVSGGTPPTPGSPAYFYVWEQSTDNGTTWAVINGQTTQNATVTITQTTRYRRTVYTSLHECSIISNEVNIATQPPITNNSITPGTISICGNTAPAIITGSTPTGGDGSFIYKWQQSTNNGVTFTDIPGATGKDYQPPILIGTVIFRRLISTALCSGTFGSTSNTYTITTNPDVAAKFTATNLIGCAPFSITSSNIATTADPNASVYSWFANGLPIGTGLIFPGYNIAAEGTTVTIKLVVSSALGCADASYSLDFTTPKVSFTVSPNSGCADATTNKLTIKFTNTSTPNNATYVWDFGDNTTYTGFVPPDHTFLPDPFGNDKTYKVTLTAQGCTASAINTIITVYPNKPLAALDVPATGCSPYAIRVKNLSLGTNSSYKFTLRDEKDVLIQTIIKTDKTDAVFNPVNADVDIKIYHVALEATNLCGTPSSTGAFPVIIAPTGIHPALSISPVNSAGLPAGCAPFLASFHNLSTGGNSYVYNIYDSNFVPVKSVPASGDINYNFDTPGTYYVTVGVFSNCAAFSESAKMRVVVYPVPVPAFTSDANTISCGSQTVNFTNKSTDGSTPVNSMVYTWDFGDGSPTSNQFSPTHTYDYKGSPYTVTLTATNANGCSNTIVKTGLIIVHPPPETNFTANPGLVVSIPVYTLNFIDKTKNGPVKWTWSFGDGIKSNQQNPSHTYADTGRYTVKLVTVTAFGCTDSVTRLVQVTGVPGQLYIPNAFMPTSLTQELRIFMVKGSGLESYTLRIFNNWGQTIFETSKLNSKGEPTEFWDGKFKGVDSPQGVYAWQISAHFINGTDWGGMSYRGSTPKRAGTLTLIR